MTDSIRSFIRKIEKKWFGQNSKIAEIEWAFIYHDTIRGRKWLEDLSLSPGRWAGNYSFFYVLTRILIDYKPNAILEFGLGESSKVISTFLKNELHQTRHLIVEQNAEWIHNFQSRFALSPDSNILHLELENRIKNSYPVTGYSGITKAITDLFDLYVIDGPFGSDRFSRNDICSIAKTFPPGHQFIILIDDYNRPGEKDTAEELLSILRDKGVLTFVAKYAGNKAQIIIATEKYKHTASL